MNSRKRKSTTTKKKYCRRGFWSGDRSRELVENVLVARSCAVCQLQPVMLWSPEGHVLITDSTILAETQALSFLLQKLGQQHQQMPCDSHTCSQARISSRIVTSVPTWEHWSVAALLCAPSGYSTALCHRFHWQYFTDCSVDESVPFLMENFAWICLIGFLLLALFDFQ